MLGVGCFERTDLGDGRLGGAQVGTKRRRQPHGYAGDTLVAVVRDDALSLSEATTVLEAMIQRRYRSPVDKLDDLI